jgi:hypothetical protein
MLKDAVNEFPGCNVGLRLENFITLDPDGIEAVAYLGRLELNGLLPKTVTWLSVSGRLVRLYRLPHKPSYGPPERCGVFLPDASLELRTGPGRLALLPPSEAKGTDGKMRCCEWVNDPWSNPVAVMPPVTLGLIKRLAWNWREATAVPDGQRRTFLAKHGWLKRAWGLNYEDLEAHLQELNRTRCVTPMSSRGVAAIAKTASRVLPRGQGTRFHVLAALRELGGPEKRWVRRGALIKRLEAVQGCTPQSVKQALQTLRATRSPWRISHKAGGFYKGPKIWGC